MDRKSRIILLVAPALLGCTSAHAEDWPMWRYDAQRTAASSRSAAMRHMKMLRDARMTWCVCGCRSPWANEVQYTGLNEAATEENDNGILCWIGRVRQRNVDLYYG